MVEAGVVEGGECAGGGEGAWKRNGSEHLIGRSCLLVVALVM